MKEILKSVILEIGIFIIIFVVWSLAAYAQTRDASNAKTIADFVVIFALASLLREKLEG